jgi:hypothetical protein
VISATKEGVKFSTSGDVGTANITVRCAATHCRRFSRGTGTCYVVRYSLCRDAKPQ